MVVRRKAAQEAPPVRRGRKAADPADYADLAPTQYHKDFARWLLDSTGYEPTSKKDFLKAVQFACDLRNGALGFNSVGQEEEEPAPKPVTRKRGAASQATKATAGKTRRAAPVEEPEEEEWEETEEPEEDEDEFEDESEEDDEDDDSDEDDDDWEDEEEEEEPAPVKRPAKKVATGAIRGRAATRTGKAAPTVAAKKAAPAKKAATGRRPAKPSDADFTF